MEGTVHKQDNGDTLLDFQGGIFILKSNGIRNDLNYCKGCYFEGLSVCPKDASVNNCELKASNIWRPYVINLY